MNARRGEPLMTTEEFLQAIHTPSAIVPAGRPAPPTPEEIDRLGPVKEVVHLLRGKLETLFPGDEMYIYSKTLGDSFVMVVDRVQEDRNGALTWLGHLKGMPRRYQVSFTQGPQFTHADLRTPRGHFVLLAQGETGWITQQNSPSGDHENTPGFAARTVSLTSGYGAR